MNVLKPTDLREAALRDWNALDRELWPESERDSFIMGFTGGARYAIDLALRALKDKKEPA